MNLDLLVFPMHDWRKGETEGFRTRDGHLLQEFDRNKKVGKILVVDRPVTLPELAIKKTAWKVKRVMNSRKIGAFCRLSQVGEKTFVLNILSPNIIEPLILRRDWWHYIFSKHSVIHSVRKAMAELMISGPVLYLWNPMVATVIGKMGERLVVFDAIDNWLLHPEIEDRRGWIAEGYRLIKKDADLIIVNSLPMQRVMSDSSVKPFLVYNGVDREYFTCPSSDLPLDLSRITKPIIGYAGKLSKRLDIGLIVKLSRHFRTASFVFIGQMLNNKWVAPLFSLPNFHYLGDKPYNELPLYLSGFDIGIIPHHYKHNLINGDPLKMYEYLAAGLPVVSTPIAGVDKFKNELQIASNPADFIFAVDNYLKLLSRKEISAEKIRGRLDSTYDWRFKAELILEKISERLET